jgi:hypothetical protein
MTRKDFEKIAEALRMTLDTTMEDAERSNAEPVQTIARRAAILRSALFVADALEESNPRFDRARFLVACGWAGIDL